LKINVGTVYNNEKKNTSSNGKNSPQFLLLFLIAFLMDIFFCLRLYRDYANIFDSALKKGGGKR